MSQPIYLGKVKTTDGKVLELGDRGKTVVIPLSSWSALQAATLNSEFLYSLPNEGIPLTSDESALDETNS